MNGEGLELPEVTRVTGQPLSLLGLGYSADFSARAVPGSEQSGGQGNPGLGRQASNSSAHSSGERRVPEQAGCPSLCVTQASRGGGLWGVGEGKGEPVKAWGEGHKGTNSTGNLSPGVWWTAWPL